MRKRHIKKVFTLRTRKKAEQKTWAKEKEEQRESRNKESWWSISSFSAIFNYPSRSKFSRSVVGVAGLHQSSSQCLLEYYYRTAAASQWADYWLGPMGGLIWLECMEAEMENRDKHRNTIYRLDVLIDFYKNCVHRSECKRPGGRFYYAMTSLWLQSSCEHSCFACKS